MFTNLKWQFLLITKNNNKGTFYCIGKKLKLEYFSFVSLKHTLEGRFVQKMTPICSLWWAAKDTFSKEGFLKSLKEIVHPNISSVKYININGEQIWHFGCTTSLSLISQIKYSFCTWRCNSKTHFFSQPPNFYFYWLDKSQWNTVLHDYSLPS